MSYEAVANLSISESLHTFQLLNWKPGMVKVDDAGVSFYERGEVEPLSRAFSDIKSVSLTTHSLAPDEITLVMHDGLHWGIHTSDGTPLVEALRAHGVAREPSARTF